LDLLACIITTILADAFQQNTRITRGLLVPPAAPPPALVADPVAQELQAKIKAARDKTLEYYRTHKPPNTTRNYAPKQQE
jgi:hypothetical protein